jgi:response regulator RpfG family c-di-GMP phosphodiesterase
VNYDLARAEIAHCQGTQFDPEVVRAFLDVPAKDWRDAAGAAAGELVRAA